MMSIRSGLVVALLSTAVIAGWTSLAMAAERAVHDSTFHVAQAPQRADAVEDEDEQRGKRRDRREERGEDRRKGGGEDRGEERRAAPQRAAPLEQEPRSAPRRQEGQPRPEGPPPRMEARPPTQPKIINEPAADRDTGDRLKARQRELIDQRRDARKEQPEDSREAQKEEREDTRERRRVDRKDVLEEGRDLRRLRGEEHRELRDERRDAPDDRRDDRQDARDGRQPDHRDSRDDRRDSRIGQPIRRLDDLKRQRRQRVEEGGIRTIIEEPDRRVIVREEGRTIIRHDETDRFRRQFKETRTERLREGGRRAIFIRPDGVQVISEYDSRDRLLRRYRRHRDGRIVVLIDNRSYLGAGLVGGLLLGALIDLPPPVVRIPRHKYVVEYDSASYDDIYEALSAPPIEDLDRYYSLDEIRYNRYLRERMRRVDLNSITFEFGSWEVPPDQYYKLEKIAKAINRLLDRNPDEIILVEGHTDAVGSDEDNLTLSDRRAEEVASILSEEFGVPPENLVTQGYGEQFLKINTQAPERENRRVALRRITPLLSRADP